MVGRCVHRRASRALLINSGDRLYMTAHSSNPKGSIHGTVDEENPQSQYDWDLVWLIYIPRRQKAAWLICLARVQVQIILFEVQDDWWIKSM